MVDGTDQVILLQFISHVLYVSDVLQFIFILHIVIVCVQYLKLLQVYVHSKTSSI